MCTVLVHATILGPLASSKCQDFKLRRCGPHGHGGKSGAAVRESLPGPRTMWYLFGDPNENPLPKAIPNQNKNYVGGSR